MKNRLRAVIWDFDGTLVDTLPKNLAVTARILREVTGRPSNHWPALNSVAHYREAIMRSSNWRELYRCEFQLSEKDTERAGALWSVFHAEDPTPVPVFEGIAEALATFEDIPQGIVSQNCRQNIRRTLAHLGLDQWFDMIVGYEEVPSNRQKPDPHGLLACLERLTGGEQTGRVAYVGDHDTDMRCAQAARAELRERGVDLEVFAIGAAFDGAQGPDAWSERPDFCARHPSKVAEVLAALDS